MNDEQQQPTPQTIPTANPDVLSHHNPSKKVLVIAVAFLVLLGGGAVAYLMSASPDDRSENTPAPVIQKPNSSEKKMVEKKPLTYTSTLWPDFSFTVPDGWDIEEPSEYDDESFGEGWTNGTITAKKGDVTVSFDMTTVAATGFEGYTCRRVDSLQKVGEYYRYIDEEGVTVYADGVGQDDEGWTSASTGEFSSSEVPDPNYCVSFPFIGTYSSTLNQADYEQPYGFTNNEKVMVWLAVYAKGELNDALRMEIDQMVLSKSESPEIL